MPPDGKALALFSMQSLDNFKFATSSRLFKLYIRIIFISSIKCTDEEVGIFHRLFWTMQGLLEGRCSPATGGGGF